MIVGVHEEKTYAAADVLATVEDFPGMSLTRVFAGGSGPLKPGASLVQVIGKACAGSWFCDQIPMASFKLQPSEVAAGTWDAELAKLGDYLATQPEAWVIPWHEPEDDLSAADFTAMFGRVYSPIKARSPRTLIGYAAMAYQWRPKSATTASPAAWRPPYCDFYGVDVYSGRSFPLGNILPEHPGFKRWLHECAPSEAPVVVSERGFELPGGIADTVRADTIARERDWLLTPAGQRIYAYSYWNSGGVEGSDALLLGTYSEPVVADMVDKLSGGRAEIRMLAQRIVDIA